MLRLKGRPELCTSANDISPRLEPGTPGSPPQKQEQTVYRLGRPLTAAERAEKLAAAMDARERERKQKAAIAELERLKVDRQIERQRSARPSSRPSSHPSSRPASRPSSRPSSRPPSSRREKLLGAGISPTGGTTSNRAVSASKSSRRKDAAKQQLVRGEGTRDFIRPDGRHVQVCDSCFTRRALAPSHLP